MKEDMEEYLEKLNPHWFGESDEDLKKWRRHKVRILPEWLTKISLQPFSLNFVIGPRRIGKTTGIKLLIRQLMEEVNPREIVYVNVDLMPDLKFFQTLLSYLNEKRLKYIFLDEATSLEDWWKPLKGFIDAGSFKSSCVTVSGSITLKVKRHAELFPGRMGKGRVIEVLPLTFPEVYKILASKPKTSELRRVFSNYISTGGFLGAINYGDSFMNEILLALESEILRSGLSVKSAFEIFSSLLEKIPSALSYQSIAGDIGIDYKTVRNYLEVFENMFLVKIAYWKHGKETSFRREKKVFFRDPFLLRTISFWTATKYLKSALYESIVQEHLLRKFGEIYYYRNSYEVDAVAGDLKIEVKAGKPHRRYPRGTIVLDEKDIPKFLIELF